VATLRTRAAQEELRAARDARYRANVECAITQVRRIIVLVMTVVTLASLHEGALACSVGPVWGARDVLLGPCVHTRAGAASYEPAHTR
jgi:hypothetical protein